MTDWLVVPREPTEEMEHAFYKVIKHWLAEEGEDNDVFKTMVNASPKKEPYIWYNFVSEEICHTYPANTDDTWIPLYDLKD